MGLAPLEALVDQVHRQGPARRVDLFVGARTEDHLHDRVALEALQRSCPWLSVTYAVSDDELSDLERGDVEDVVLRHGPWLSREAYAAGPAPMVEQTVDGLLQHGVPRERVRSEVFAPSRPGPSAEGKVTG